MLALAVAGCSMEPPVAPPPQQPHVLARPAPPPLALAQPVPADLSNLGPADFRIAFTIRTTAQVGSAVINQRAACSHGNFWGVRSGPGGGIGVETDDGANYTVLVADGTTRINDGAPHRVTITRRQGVLAISVDNGQPFRAPSAASFGPLPELRIGADPCDGVDGTVPLDGTVTDVALLRG
jgi:hypothetical protein